MVCLESFIVYHCCHWKHCSGSTKYGRRKSSRLYRHLFYDCQGKNWNRNFVHIHSFHSRTTCNRVTKAKKVNEVPHSGSGFMQHVTWYGAALRRSGRQSETPLSASFISWLPFTTV